MLVHVSAQKGHSEMLGIHGHGCVFNYAGMQAQMARESVYVQCTCSMHACRLQGGRGPPTPASSPKLVLRVGRPGV